MKALVEIPDDEKDSDMVEVRSYVRRKQHKTPQSLNEAARMINQEMNQPEPQAQLSKTSRKEKP